MLRNEIFPHDIAQAIWEWSKIFQNWLAFTPDYTRKLKSTSILWTPGISVGTSFYCDRLDPITPQLVGNLITSL